MKALVIRPGAITLETIDLPDGDTQNYNAIKAIIGNWMTSCFSIRTDEGRITGLCDDEFLLSKRQDWSCAIGDTLRTDAPYPIGGPIVIQGFTEEGESRSLTDDELTHFTLGSEVYFRKPYPGKLRLLQWEG